MLEDAVVETLRLCTDSDVHRVGLLVAGTGALVDTQNAVAITEGVAADGCLGVYRRIDLAAQPLANLGGGTGVLANRDGTGIGLLLQVAGSLEAVVDHDPAVHLHAFPAALPVVQCLLKGDSAIGYAALAGITLERAQIVVQASGMRGLTLENDDATLSAAKAS